MLIVALSVATFLSTLLGGLIGLKNQKKIHALLGFTAGVLLGVVAFELLPEIFELAHENNQSPTGPMVALVAGFLLFHSIEKSILIHYNREQEYGPHHHPHVGIASVLALIGHSFLDGIAIGLGFQASQMSGIVLALAVIAHHFTHGLNTVNIMIATKNHRSRVITFLLLAALAPILGALSTIFFDISEVGLVTYLGFFAGFLLYIGASEILPEAHSKRSSYTTIGLTVLGAGFMFLLTRFA